MKAVRIGICGLGTVGSGAFNIIHANSELIARRAGCPLVVTAVASRRQHPDCDLSEVRFTSDLFEVARDPQVDVVVELIGGCSTAKDVVLEAIANGKHVVTANKALIAEHGNQIFEAARGAGVIVGYEASVAGGIPVIKAMREGLAANRIDWIAGIINGTGNFILTEMQARGRDFSAVLAEAQQLGYAEADPTFDVEGIDAAHKLAILASIAFAMPLQFARVYTEGISHVTRSDIRHADELGYRIKHLGIARRTAEGVELRVHPTLIPKTRLIANVDGVMNAVAVHGDAVGTTLYYGAGAGAMATGSAVVADLIDIVRGGEGSGQGMPSLGAFEVDANLSVLPVDGCVTAFYLRISVKDHPGVLEKIGRILGTHGINVESIMQKEAELKDGVVPMFLLTHRVQERAMNHAIAEMEDLEDVVGAITRIRVEQLSG